MRSLYLRLVIFPLFGMISPNEISRSYDNDGQHKRPAPTRPPEARQLPLGYEPIETTSAFWQQKAQNILASKLAETPVRAKAKNVIFFIGDGMSPQTIAATRMYLGNENKMLAFDEFPYLGTARTYCVDRQVPDSACTASAYLSGVKVNYGTINVGASVPRYSCAYNRTEAEFLGLLKWAQDNDMATGVVTTTRITHATPAGTYASTADRDWEDDSYVRKAGCDPSQYPDIADQLVNGEVGKRIKVILGGGRRHFYSSTQRDEENSPGSRADGRNLVNEWLSQHSDWAEYVWNQTSLQAVNVDNTSHLLGLFESSHCLYNLEIDEGNLQASEPKLSEMVVVAVKMLRKSESGFFLFVEGGRIDTAHHETRPRLALEETAEYSKAIGLARQMTSVEDTLIVVSSDHSHTMTYNGYQTRGNDILGIADISDIDELPYTTLSYANGEGYFVAYTPDNLAERADISGLDFSDFHSQYPATVPRDSETHGGEDVAVYASGPMAHIFRGNFEQNVIPSLIAYAAEIGPFAGTEQDSDGSGSAVFICFRLAVICGVIGLLVQLRWYRL
ncbi:alkaline phosphatase-like [Toxorhynchites rutilus septentrionalis]|uniref:alkaline phosphatase-like n=1 Tax=Toxorhynchites rutilus septentrionalis TaxID=329112 RepID=UPI00247A7C15|nr:alkaline phosphatase-like [Toxorhynchites rutilus septentrionalis]